MRTETSIATTNAVVTAVVAPIEIVYVDDESIVLPAVMTSADQNPVTVYLASLTSELSRRTMTQVLNAIAYLLTNGRQDAQALHWAALRFQHTAAIRAQLSERHKPATVNKMLSALRGVLKTAYNLGQITPDDFQKASNFKAVKGETIPKGRDLKSGEVIALSEACKADSSPAGKRDRAMIAVLYTCGLRRAELAALAIEDVDRDSGKITIQRGKGRKSRIVWATNGALTALQTWLAVLDATGITTGALFGMIGRHKVPTGEQMTTQAVYVMLKKRARQAGVKDFSPHDLRRTFVSDLLDRGADIVTVQHLAGHASPTTTARYDRRGEETKKKAANLLHFPD